MVIITHISDHMFVIQIPIVYFLGDEIGEFLNGATEGAIYISFGSILQGSQMSDDRRKLFLNVFRFISHLCVTSFINDVTQIYVFFFYSPFIQNDTSYINSI